MVDVLVTLFAIIVIPLGMWMLLMEINPDDVD